MTCAGVGARLMRSASAYAYACGLPALSGSVQPQLVAYYERLGGLVQAQQAICSDGAPVPAQRLRAPSGPETAKGEAVPDRIGSVRENACNNICAST